MEHKCPTCGHPMVKRTSNTGFFSSVFLFFSSDKLTEESPIWECCNKDCIDYKVEESVREEEAAKHKKRK